MKSTSIYLILLSAIVFISACKKDDDNECIQGNGDLIQETRNIGDFNEIYASGAFNISFSQLNNPRIDLFGDSNVLPIIITTVSNDILSIETNDDACYSTQSTIEVTATAANLKGIKIDGAGIIEAHNITTDRLDYETNGAVSINSSLTAKLLTVTMTGSGDAQLTGSTENGGFNIGGDGSIQASTLIVDICTITIEGAGDISIHVNDEMTVVISGSGNVYYTGDPDINSLITGTGQIIKQD